MQVLGNYLRLLLLHVDPVLWCYCAEFIALSWNLIPRDFRRHPENNGETPRGILKKNFPDFTFEGGPDTLAGLRRFGCLAWFLKEPKPEKLQTRWLRGVYLGHSRDNSSYLIGHFVADGRTRTSLRWAHSEAKTARFREDILVYDINLLKPNSRGDSRNFNHSLTRAWKGTDSIV